MKFVVILNNDTKIIKGNVLQQSRLLETDMTVTVVEAENIEDVKIEVHGMRFKAVRGSRMDSMGNNKSYNGFNEVKKVKITRINEWKEEGI